MENKAARNNFRREAEKSAGADNIGESTSLTSLANESKQTNNQSNDQSIN